MVFITDAVSSETLAESTDAFKIIYHYIFYIIPKLKLCTPL